MREREIPEMHIGTVAELWRYPVKSLAAESLDEASVEMDGLAGDRKTALIVRNADHARSGKPLRGKEHNLLHTVATQAEAESLAADAGIALTAISGERYFDAQPVSVIFDTWLRDVEALAGRSLDPLRYRPNIYAHAAPDFAARELALVGARLSLGGVALKVVATIKRCVTTTYDVATGVSDPVVLREVALARANTVGVYCTVEHGGTIARGDAIAQS